MKTPSLPLAMKGYEHWYGSLLEPDRYLIILYFGGLVWLTLNLWKFFPLRGAYFSPLFFLTLLPGICCWLSATHQLSEYHWRYVDNAEQMLTDIANLQKGGVVTTLCAVGAYSVAYFASRYFRPVVASAKN